MLLTSNGNAIENTTIKCLIFASINKTIIMVVITTTINNNTVIVVFVVNWKHLHANVFVIVAAAISHNW